MLIDEKKLKVCRVALFSERIRVPERYIFRSDLHGSLIGDSPALIKKIASYKIVCPQAIFEIILSSDIH